MSAPNEVASVDLGKIFAQSAIDLTLRISNKCDKEFVCKDVIASCGCLGTIRKDLKVAVGEAGDLGLQFQASLEAGDFEKSVAIVNADSSRFTIVIKGQIVKPVLLRPYSFVVTSEAREKGVAKFEFTLSRDKEFAVDWGAVNWSADFLTDCDAVLLDRKDDDPHLASISVAFDPKKLNLLLRQLRPLDLFELSLSNRTTR
jgi:hypothetical protein